MGQQEPAWAELMRKRVSSVQGRRPSGEHVTTPRRKQMPSCHGGQKFDNERLT